jgi:uncharacterized protein YceK
MHSKLLMTVLFSSLLAISGCSTVRTASATKSPSSESNIDVGYVSNINKQALERGSEVMWVNPPLKSKPLEPNPVH